MTILFKICNKNNLCIIYSFKYQEAHQKQPKSQSKSTKQSSVSSKLVVTDGSKGFWELYEHSLKGSLNPVELNRFLASIRQVTFFL